MWGSRTPTKPGCPRRRRVRVAMWAPLLLRPRRRRARQPVPESLLPRPGWAEGDELDAGLSRSGRDDHGGRPSGPRPRSKPILRYPADELAGLAAQRSAQLAGSMLNEHLSRVAADGQFGHQGVGADGRQQLEGRGPPQPARRSGSMATTTPCRRRSTTAARTSTSTMAAELPTRRRGSQKGL